MFIELVDQLRCPNPHVETALVLSTSRMRGRAVVEGWLGCPVCRARFAIERGDVRLAPDVAPPERPAPYASGEETLRIAAMLGLAEPGGWVALVGAMARFAAPLRALVDARLVLLDPTHAVEPGVDASVVLAGGRVPLAAAALRGAALPPTAGEALAGDIARALRPGGRLVGPTTLRLPDRVVELARDADEWVGERSAALSAPVVLRRGHWR